MKTWIYDLLDEMLERAFAAAPRPSQGEVVIQTCLLSILAR